MLGLTLTAFALAAGNGAVVWVDAWQAAEAVVPQKGEYQVWVWAKAGHATHVTVAGKRLDIDRKKDKNDRDYVWVNAGMVRLDAGPVPLIFGEEVKTLALSAAPSFDPKKAMGDRRVYAEPRGVEDRRARTVRHTNTVFMMPHHESLEAWERDAGRLRRRILLSSGLLPLPERTPLNARVFDRIERDGYSVEKVHFEAWPGFLVTGNLYRPIGEGPFPAIVNPHGHWQNGRLENSETGSVPGRCITLARMGIVAFSYDMIGYNDSMQFPHNWGGEREKLWGVHPFAMQLWSSIRAVDFVESLPYVDRDRIGCTGASGGGTQTFALMAVDMRIKAAAPVNMISSTMQGGCLCENAPVLRLDNSNMEIGALMAPRPLLLVSATGDWTRETPRVEYPAIRSIYALYDAADKVSNVHIDAGHNYNQASREAMYRFFGRCFLGERDWDQFTEPPFEVEDEAALRVFADKQAISGYPSRDEVIASVIARIRDKWRAILPQRPEDAPAFRKRYGGLPAEVIGATVPHPNDLSCERVSIEKRGDHVLERWIIGRAREGDAIPALFYRSDGPEAQDAVLLVHGAGKAALADPDGNGPGPLVSALIAEDRAVLCIDAFLIGEHHAPDVRTERRREGNFMDTFQPTDAAYRVQDVITAMTFLRARRDLTGRITLAGLEEAGLWCLFAGAIDGGAAATLADMNGFALDDDDAWVKDCYIPCIRAVGDVRTAAALIAPRRLTLMNTGAPDDGGWCGAHVETGTLPLDAIVEALR